MTSFIFPGAMVLDFFGGRKTNALTPISQIKTLRKKECEAKAQNKTKGLQFSGYMK